jgi:hypothetical protein
MATITKALARTAAATTSTTLYTVPAATTTIVSNIVISNNSSSAVTATMTLDGISILPTVSIAANSVFGFDLKQVLAATKIIAGFSSVTTTTFHISGVEIS